MNLDSVLRKIQRGEKLVCPCCGKEFSSLNSEWDSGHHYKSLICSCGKKRWVKVDFHGSGHDTVLLERKFAIEPEVSIVRGGLMDSRRG